MAGNLQGLILASASPRRRQLLEMLGVRDFKIEPAEGEEIVPPGLAPDETVRRLALAKAREVAERCGAGIPIVAADTIVYIDGDILGKPGNRHEAELMLDRLQGRTHSVFTGVAVLFRDTELLEAEETRVTFRKMSVDEIAAYVATGEPMDKAGAYGAQGIGSVFVEKIDGDFYNVVGLPLCRLGIMLGRIGADII